LNRSQQIANLRQQLEEEEAQIPPFHLQSLDDPEQEAHYWKIRSIIAQCCQLEDEEQTDNDCLRFLTD